MSPTILASREEENQGLVPILSDHRPGRPFPGAPGSGYLLGFRRRLGLILRNVRGRAA
jgi:hypothetical protein